MDRNRDGLPSRESDVPDGAEAAGGQGVGDGADRLLIELAQVREPIAVLDDPAGAITLALAERGVADLRSHHDSLLARRALQALAAASPHGEWTAVGPDGRPLPAVQSTSRVVGIGPADVAAAAQPDDAASQANEPDAGAALAGARTVIWRLPKSLDAIRDMAALIATHADPDVTVYAGARIKYLGPTVPATLEEAFEHVSVSRAREKSRVLTCRGPKPVRPREAARGSDREFDVQVRSFGGVFAGAKLDLGSRFLASFVPQMMPDARSALDLGSGNGSLASLVARARPGLEVWAVDESVTAVRATRATADANGVRLHARWDDAGDSLPAGSFDLVLLNPPFHTGGPIDRSAGYHLIEAAGRLLAPGGELWTVFNSHLRYRGALAGVGHTVQLGRNPKFTVTRTRKPN